MDNTIKQLFEAQTAALAALTKRIEAIEKGKPKEEEPPSKEATSEELDKVMGSLF